jgi:hypothetical protein
LGIITNKIMVYIIIIVTIISIFYGRIRLLIHCYRSIPIGSGERWEYTGCTFTGVKRQ